MTASYGQHEVVDVNIAIVLANPTLPIQNPSYSIIDAYYPGGFG